MLGQLLYIRCTIVIVVKAMAENDEKLQIYEVPTLELLCKKCGTKLDVREKLQALLKLLYAVKELKIVQHGVLAKQGEEIRALSDELDSDTKEIIKKLDKCPLKEVKRYEVKIKAMKARKQFLASKKASLMERRLLLRNFVAIEQEIRVAILKLEREGKFE